MPIRRGCWWKRGITMRRRRARVVVTMLRLTEEHQALEEESEQCNE